VPGAKRSSVEHGAIRGQHRYSVSTTEQSVYSTGCKCRAWSNPSSVRSANGWDQQLGERCRIREKVERRTPGAVSRPQVEETPPNPRPSFFVIIPCRSKGRQGVAQPHSRLGFRVLRYPLVGVNVPRIRSRNSNAIANRLLELVSCYGPVSVRAPIGATTSHCTAAKR
jgi:hypothetical protein